MGIDWVKVLCTGQTPGQSINIMKELLRVVFHKSENGTTMIKIASATGNFNYLK